MKKMISIVSAIAMVATMATSFVTVNATEEWVGTTGATSAVATKLTAEEYKNIVEDDLGAGMVPYKVTVSVSDFGKLNKSKSGNKYTGRMMNSEQFTIKKLETNSKVVTDCVWNLDNALNTTAADGYDSDSGDYTAACTAAAAAAAYPISATTQDVTRIDKLFSFLFTLNTEETVELNYEVILAITPYTNNVAGDKEDWHALGTITFGETATLDNVKIAGDAVRNMKVGGDNITLEAKAYNTDEAENTTATITWSSDTPAVATVNETTGVVTAVAEGTAVITATAKDGDITKTSTVTVNVAKADPKLAKIEVSGADTVEAESTITLTATGKDQYGEVIAADFTWESDDPAVATGVNGVVTGVSEGTAKITAKSGSVVSDEFEVTVTAKAPAGPSFEGDGAGTQVKDGENVIGYVWPSAKIKNFKAGKYSITFTAGEDSTKRGLSFDAIDTNGDVGFVVVLNTSKGSVSMTIGYDAE